MGRGLQLFEPGGPAGRPGFARFVRQVLRILSLPAAIAPVLAADDNHVRDHRTGRGGADRRLATAVLGADLRAQRSRRTGAVALGLPCRGHRAQLPGLHFHGRPDVSGGHGAAISAKPAVCRDQRGPVLLVAANGGKRGGRVRRLGADLRAGLSAGVPGVGGSGSRAGGCRRRTARVLGQAAPLCRLGLGDELAYEPVRHRRSLHDRALQRPERRRCPAASRLLPQFAIDPALDRGSGGPAGHDGHSALKPRLGSRPPP